MLPSLLAGALVLVVVAIVLVRRGRAVTLASVRRTWATPVARERRFDVIAATHAQRVQELGDAPRIDDRTWADLNLDDVFAVLDRTSSTLGQHALYHRLRTLGGGTDRDAWESLVATFEREAAVREASQVALLRLADPMGYPLWWLARDDAGLTPGWCAVFPLLTLATLSLVVAAIAWPGLVPSLLLALLANVVIRFLTDRHVGALARAFRQLAPIIASAEDLRRSVPAGASPLLQSFASDVEALRTLKQIARWVNGDPLMISVGADMILVAIQDVLTSVYEYLNLGLQLDGTGVFLGARALRSRRGELLRVIATVGDVDVAISVASLRGERDDWCRPEFAAPRAVASLTDLKHPLLAAAVPNSLTLEPGRGMLITGSNMSGKSTLLRTVGVAQVMAQALNTCLATTFVSPAYRVRSAIGRSDDILSGTSYYIAEVKLLLALIEASTGDAAHLFLLDELFRGTNAVERIAAGQAVLLELLSSATRPSPHVALAATHDGELVDLLPPVYVPFHFGDVVGDEGLVFDHRLRQGPATTRNAIALLRLHGAPRELIERALASAAALDTHRAGVR